MAKTVKERAAVTFDNLICTGIVLVILLYLPVFFQMDFLNVFQESIEDFYVTDLIYSGGRDDVGMDTNIVLVNFGSLDRSEVAEQIKIINKYKPKVIGIDAFYRDEKKGRKKVVVPLGDQTYFNNPDYEVLAAEPMDDSTMKLVVGGDVVDPPLVKAFNETERLVLACELINPLDSNQLFMWDTLLNSHEKFRKNIREGFVNMNTNKEEFLTVRHFTVKTHVHEDTVVSFAVQIASLYDSIKVAKLFERGEQRELINFKRNLDKYKVLDWDEVFQKKDSLQFIKDKIVLMGYLGPDTSTIVTEDIFYSPMNNKIYGRAYPDMYGVVIHANIISMILEGDYINSMLGWPSWILLMMSGILILFNMMILNYVRIHNEKWGEPVSLFLLLFEFGGILALVLLLQVYFSFELKNPSFFFAIILSGTVFETYHGSLKPLTISFYKKLSGVEKK